MEDRVTKAGIYILQQNQKLSQNHNSKWRNFAMAFILNLVNSTDTTKPFDLKSCHTTVLNPYLQLDFQKAAGKCDFFHVAKAAVLLKSHVTVLRIVTCFLN